MSTERLRKNPLPEFVGHEPDAHDGDFLDGLMHTIRSSSRANSLEAIGADNFRARPEESKTSNPGDK